MESSVPPRFITTSLGEAVIPQVNRDTFSKTGSKAVFQRHFGNQFQQPDTLYLVIGTDSGLLPAWIHRQGLPAGSRYLFLEPETLIDGILGRCAELFDNERCFLSNEAQWEQLEDKLQLDDYAYLGNLQVICSIGARDAYLSDYLALEQALRSYVQRVQQEVGQQKGSHAFLRKQIENIADNVFPASLLRQQFAGHSAVLLAGGPSLDDILPWVEAHREKLVVLSVSRISRQLLSCGIRPDFVFHIDPHPLSFDVSRESLLLSRRTVLICGNHAYAGIQAQFPGPVLYCGRRFPHSCETEPDNLPSAGPTVTNLALATAIGMGFSRVILGGVDLCHDRHGNTHASGSNERTIGPALAGTGYRVETNGGWMADSTHSFFQATKVLGQQAELAIRAGCEIINPAPGAARIDNVIHQPLREIELPLPTSDRPDIEALLAPYTPAFRHQALQDGQAALRDLRRQAREIERLCQEARRWNEKIYCDDGTHDLRFKKRMDKIENRLDGRYRETTQIIKRLGLAAFLRLIKPAKAQDEWTPEELRSWGDAYYRVYAENAAALIKLIDYSQTKVVSRLEELAPRPDMDRLLADWEATNIPGRVERFLAERSEVAMTLTHKQHAGCERLRRQFQEAIRQQHTRHHSAVRQRHDLRPVRARLQLLFHQRKLDELQDIEEALQRLDDPLAKELYSLAAGYRAELKDMTEEALNWYQQVVDAACTTIDAADEQRANPRLEDALQRIAFLALEGNDSDTALAALDALSALSPLYEPHYAELLRLRGRYQEAANIYTNYLKRVPDDLDALLKLGKLYRDVGAVESARWVFEQVMSQTPDDPVIRKLLTDLPGETRAT